MIFVTGGREEERRIVGREGFECNERVRAFTINARGALEQGSARCWTKVSAPVPLKGGSDFAPPLLHHLMTNTKQRLTDMNSQSINRHEQPIDEQVASV